MKLVRISALAGLIAVVGVTPVASGATPTSHQSSSAVEVFGGARTPGVPPGGPAALYAPPPKLAMTTNHDRRFRAPYNLASGTERYIGGEYQYTGYAYDDDDNQGAYPGSATNAGPGTAASFARYGNNSANLIEFRIAPYNGGTLYRFTFNTLLQKDSTIATVAFNADRNAKTGSSTLPKDPGLPFPGTDFALTTWGTGAHWSRWTGSAWRTSTLKVKTDLAANQMTVDVPSAISHPTGEWNATLATGLYDPATKGWLNIASHSTNNSNIINLGFRFNECRFTGPNPPGGANGAPWEHMAVALKAGTPTTFEHTLHFDWLAKRKYYDNIPTRGQFLRMAPSFLAGGTANLGSVPTGISATDAVGQDNKARKPAFFTEGKMRPGAFETQYFSPLQPYVVYIPPHYKPGMPSRLTFWLHPDGGEYYGFGSTYDIPKVKRPRFDAVSF